MAKLIKHYKRENEILWNIIKDIIWMAIRYAHGRHTYAPSIIRDSVATLKRLDKNFKLRNDITVEPPEDESQCRGFNFRSDYLDDLFERED